MSGNEATLTRPDLRTDFAVVNYDCFNAATPGDGAHLASEQQVGCTAGSLLHLYALARLPNIGNTCYFNALLQCFRQMLLRVPSDQLPKSRTCPLANALPHHAFTDAEVSQWECWAYLPVGCQRDACHILEICLGVGGFMHSNCQAGDCYGELLRNMTSFEMTLEVLCGCCPCASQQSQRQCVMHVEPDARSKLQSITLWQCVQWMASNVNRVVA